MLEPDPAALLRTLNKFCTKSLEAAAGICLSRGHYEVTVEHLLASLIVDPNADLHLIFRNYGIEKGQLDKQLQRHLEVERSGNSGRPVFSPLLLTWMRDAWLLSSTELRQPSIRSGALLATLLLAPHTYTSGAWPESLSAIKRDELRQQLLTIAAGSMESEVASMATASSGEAGAPAGPHSRGSDTALGKFTIDFTAQARTGDLDPVIGRESEIRQCIDVLARRRKNNPIIVGEAGVGKTALVEGIAQRIVADEVPDQLANVDLLGLDLGLLQAGAGVKGEFENRLKSVIEEVKGSAKPIVLFIDEAHTLIGAGGAAGGGDAANLLKPALARGELRTLAATTWSEYKKYFEKDPALSRRFQLVKVDEPSEENAIAMMRGLAPHYEKSHAIRILDEAVIASVELSSRYISGRQLPDKAVDLLDTCAARVAIGQQAKPGRLSDLERQIQILGREEVALQREIDEGYAIDPSRLKRVEADLTVAAKEKEDLHARWEKELAAARQVMALRREITATGEDPKDVPAEGDDGGEATEVRAQDVIRKELDQAQAALADLQAKETLVPVDVDTELVASVVADWTGVPVGKMVEDEAEVLLTLEDEIRKRIKGQDEALRALGEVIRASKLGLANPNSPNGVFLLVGPSGVGKTETALAISDLLFGGERFLVTINMSEFQEKHTVSRLIGSPPGYVGYGEGGVLTEAVRQRPYSPVVLDEVEKADPEVMNLFYQVFDKGMLSDGEGREIDFKNTILLLTSNLGSDVMTEMCQADPPPTPQEIIDAIRPILSNHFKPALLARMNIVPYFALNSGAMREIVDLKLGGLIGRLQTTHGIEMTVEQKVSDQIAARCREVETGARNIDHIMSRTLLPLISRSMLDQMSKGPLPSKMQLILADDGEFQLRFDK